MIKRGYSACRSARPIPPITPVPPNRARPAVNGDVVGHATKNTFGIVNNNENTMGRRAPMQQGRTGVVGIIGKGGAVGCNTNNGRGGRNQYGNNGTTMRNNTPWNRNARTPRGGRLLVKKDELRRKRGEVVQVPNEPICCCAAEAAVTTGAGKFLLLAHVGATAGREHLLLLADRC
jgi:hypothetical protein